MTPAEVNIRPSSSSLLCDGGRGSLPPPSGAARHYMYIQINIPLPFANYLGSYSILRRILAFSFIKNEKIQTNRRAD